MLTIQPCLRSRMEGSTSCDRWKGAQLKGLKSGDRRKQMGWMAPAPGLRGPMWLLSCKPEHWEPPTMEIITIGLDLAKNVFQVHAVSSTGEVVVRRALRRAQVLPFFSKLSPCLVGME